MLGPFLDVQMSFCVACARIVHQAKGEGFVGEGFLESPKNNGKRGGFEEDLERCILRGSGNTRDRFIRDVR